MRRRYIGSDYDLEDDSKGNVHLVRDTVDVVGRRCPPRPKVGDVIRWDGDYARVGSRMTLRFEKSANPPTERPKGKANDIPVCQRGKVNSDPMVPASANFKTKTMVIGQDPASTVYPKDLGDGSVKTGEYTARDIRVMDIEGAL